MSENKLRKIAPCDYLMHSNVNYYANYYGSYLMHHGVKGQHWGKRRYQNPDGSLTPEGYAHYGIELNKLKAKKEKGKPGRLANAYVNVNRAFKKPMAALSAVSMGALTASSLKMLERYGANISPGTKIAKIGVNAVSAALGSVAGSQIRIAVGKVIRTQRREKVNERIKQIENARAQYEKANGKSKDHSASKSSSNENNSRKAADDIIKRSKKTGGTVIDPDSDDGKSITGASNGQSFTITGDAYKQFKKQYMK